MIKILNDWLEIGQAVKLLDKNNLPKHIVTQKNWDLYQLYMLVKDMPKTIKVVDLGYWGLCVLKLLYSMKLQDLHGVDLSIKVGDRLSQLTRMIENRTFKVPFHLYQKDLCQTSFKDNIFDIAVCLSVIEHGVDLHDFLIESHRIIKPGGILFITTDYWEQDIDVDDKIKPYGLKWSIFSRKRIERMLDLSYNNGFELLSPASFPKCQDKCVTWNNYEYTTINIILKKR